MLHHRYPLRLLCNLFDGMVAVEGGKQSAIGSLYNEFPDHVADSLLIVGLGYAIGQSDLGWFAALAAALTAYVRVFGGSLGLTQSFMGPMAKQHRMDHKKWAPDRNRCAHFLLRCSPLFREFGAIKD